jgi:(heptosyl)LPS beta-1,4-glucosyltransferase
MTQGKGLDLPAREDLAIIHNNYESIEQYIERMNRYTTLQAKGLIKEGYEFSWKDIITKPTSEFLSRYFAGQGYKDGLHGLALALLQAFSELTLYLKTWQSEKFKEQEIDMEKIAKTMKKQVSDLHYWQADALFKGGGGVLQKIKRKLKLS